MDSAAEIRRIGERAHREPITVVTPVGDYNENHSEAKLTKQVRWIKDKLGLGTVFTFVTAVAGTVLVIVQLASPAVEQGKINGTTNAKIDNLAVAQRDSEDRQAKALAVAIEEIKTLLKDQSSVTLQTRDDLRSMRESNDRRFDMMTQKVDSTWNWMIELKNRVGMIEAQQKKEK